MISKVVSNSAVKVSYLVGVNEEGNDIIKSQRFNDIDITATSDSIYSVATSIGTLISKPVTEITLEEDSLLIEEQA